MGLIKHPYRVMRYGVTEEKELDARPVIGWTWDFPVYERETNDDALAAALGVCLKHRRLTTRPCRNFINGKGCLRASPLLSSWGL